MEIKDCKGCAFYCYWQEHPNLHVCTFYETLGQVITGCLCNRRYYLTATEAYEAFRRFAIERAGAQSASPEQEANQ